MKYLIGLMMLLSVPAYGILNIELALPEKSPSIITLNVVCVNGLSFLVTSTRSGAYNSVQSQTIQIYEKIGISSASPKTCGKKKK